MGAGGIVYSPEKEKKKEKADSSLRSE